MEKGCKLLLRDDILTYLDITQSIDKVSKAIKTEHRNVFSFASSKTFICAMKLGLYAFFLLSRDLQTKKG